MRTPNLGSVSYEPGQVPTDPAQIPQFLREELINLASIVRKLAEGHIDPTYVAPTKPRRGDIRYADGTRWNPGGGEGMYFYNGAGTWVQMG